MTKSEVSHLQRSMNRFTENHPDLGYASLRVDGDFGRLTKERIRQIKYLIGYSRENMTPTVDENFFKRMNHPTQVNPAWGQTKEPIARGKERRTKRRRSVRRNRIHAFLKPGIGTFDGIPVAKCAIPILTWCRNHGWNGRLVSGWRSAKHSEDICIAMCGHVSCPGKCAGRSTNHTGNSPARFAMDVSDFVNFGHVVAKCPLQPKVHNALPRDLVHFSPSGN